MVILTQQMRQAEDSEYAGAMARLRIHEPTDEDIRVGYPYRIVPYRTFPLRFYYRARAEHPPCTVRYDLFCERDMAIRYGSINVRYGLMNVRFGSRMLEENHIIL